MDGRIGGMDGKMGGIDRWIDEMDRWIQWRIQSIDRNSNPKFFPKQLNVKLSNIAANLTDLTTNLKSYQ